jgi:hypothetical protein
MVPLELMASVLRVVLEFRTNARDLRQHKLSEKYSKALSAPKVGLPLFIDDVNTDLAYLKGFRRNRPSAFATVSASFASISSLRI